MSHKRETIENTFSLFSQDIPMETIAKKMSISKATLYKWREKYNWDERKKGIVQKVSEKLDETHTKVKLKQMKIIKDIIDEYMERMKAKEIAPTTKEVIAALKHELHLIGEAEESVEHKGGITLEAFKEVYDKFRKGKKGDAGEP